MLDTLYIFERYFASVFPAKNHKSLLINPSPSCFFTYDHYDDLVYKYNTLALNVPAFGSGVLKTALAFISGPLFLALYEKKYGRGQWPRAMKVQSNVA